MRSSWLPPPDPEATCVVTGASSGIGAALARELASRGFGVTLVARRADRLRALAAELSAAHPVRAETLPCDLADAEARAALPGSIEGLGLRVDLLASNAGLGSYGDFIASDLEREIQQVRVMCEAPVDLCRAFGPEMADRGRGAILLVSSSVALMPLARYATYGATRSFGLAFGEALHTELRHSGVAVTTVCPGPVRTEFFDANGPQPVQRVVPEALWKDPDAVARAAIDGLARNRRLVIPGPAMRASMAAAGLVPRGLMLRVTDRYVRMPGDD